MHRLKRAQQEFVVCYPMDKNKSAQMPQGSQASLGTTEQHNASGSSEEYSKKLMFRSSQTVKRSHLDVEENELPDKRPCLELVDELISQSQNIQCSQLSQPESEYLCNSQLKNVPTFAFPMAKKVCTEDLPHPNRLGKPVARKRVNKRNSVESHIQQLWQKQVAWGKRTSCAVDKKLTMVHRAKIFDTPRIQPFSSPSLKAVTDSHPSLTPLVQPRVISQSQTLFGDATGDAPMFQSNSVQRSDVLHTTPASNYGLDCCDQATVWRNESSRLPLPSPRETHPSTSPRAESCCNVCESDPSYMDTEPQLPGIFHNSVTQMASHASLPVHDTHSRPGRPHTQPHFTWREAREATSKIPNFSMHRSVRISVTTRCEEAAFNPLLVREAEMSPESVHTAPFLNNHSSHFRSCSDDDIALETALDHSCSLNTSANGSDELSFMDESEQTCLFENESRLTSTPSKPVGSPLRLSPIVGYQPNLSPIIETSFDQSGLGKGKLYHMTKRSPLVED